MKPNTHLTVTTTASTNEELVASYRQCAAILDDIEEYAGEIGGAFVSVPVSPRWIASPFISKRMLREEVTGQMNGIVCALLERGAMVDGVDFVTA